MKIDGLNDINEQHSCEIMVDTGCSAAEPRVMKCRPDTVRGSMMGRAVRSDRTEGTNVDKVVIWIADPEQRALPLLFNCKPQGDPPDQEIKERPQNTCRNVHHIGGRRGRLHQFVTNHH